MHGSGPRVPVRGADPTLRKECAGGIGSVAQPVGAAAMQKVCVADRRNQRKACLHRRRVSVVGLQ